MRNRFVCIGSLLEYAIQYYATHAKIRMALDVNGQTITIQQTISRKWAHDQLAALDNTIPYLHPRIKGMVTKNGKEPVYTMLPSVQPTRLMVSGNINEWHGNIYFNGQYMRIVANMADSINIAHDGVVDISDYGLQVADCRPLDEYIDDEQMKKILLELEIMA